MANQEDLGGKFSKSLNASQIPTKQLGLYLLCVGACQLVLTVWTQARGGESLSYVRYGLFALLDLLDFKFYIYYALALWIIGLGIMMVLGFAPLKTYLVGEFILNLPTVYLMIALLRDMSNWKFLVFPALLLAESIIPSAWAIVLLWRRWKFGRLREPPFEIPGLRSLGTYLLIVASVQAVWLVGYHFEYTTRFLRVASLLEPVPSAPSILCGFFIGPNRLTRQEMDTDTPKEIEEAEKEAASFPNRDFCSVVPFLVDLGFAVAMLRGLQPFKTLLALFVPDVLMGLLVVAKSVHDRDVPVLGGFHLCASLVPFTWVGFLLVRRRRLRKGAASHGDRRIRTGLLSNKPGLKKLVVFALLLAGFLAMKEDVPRQFELETNPGQKPSFTANILDAVALATPTAGWAVGDAGTILHTEDGGKSWTPQASHTQDPLECVAFANAQSAWAVGWNGTILHTGDGGKTWTLQFSEPYQRLFSVSFASQRSGWAVGGEGTILHTENGGNTWTHQASQTRNDLHSVAFPTPRSGWAVGDAGTILHTRDGGKTWIMQGSWDNLFNPSFVVFVNPQSGWITGDEGTILHTDDAGKTWNRHTSVKEDINLSSIAFANPQSGWAVGNCGNILQTRDGGKTWVPQSSYTQNDLRSVTFVSPQSGWIVGDNGVILHTDDGGKDWIVLASGTRNISSFCDDK